VNDISKRAESVAREVRRWEFDELELRANDDSDTLTLRGEASVVDHPYEVHDAFGTFTETITAGAFNKTLSEKPDVVLLVNHEGLPLARTTSGTLKLSADPSLTVEASLEPTDPDVQRVAKKMQRGDLNEMSFAFRVPEGRSKWNDDFSERMISEVSLARGDVSVVTYGANPATSASIRSLGGVDYVELDVALEAIRNGGASDDQFDLAVRAHRSLDGLFAEVRAAAATPALDPAEVSRFLARVQRVRDLERELV